MFLKQFLTLKNWKTRFEAVLTLKNEYTEIGHPQMGTKILISKLFRENGNAMITQGQCFMKNEATFEKAFLYSNWKADEATFEKSFFIFKLKSWDLGSDLSLVKNYPFVTFCNMHFWKMKPPLKKAFLDSNLSLLDHFQPLMGSDSKHFPETVSKSKS